MTKISFNITMFITDATPPWIEIVYRETLDWVFFEVFLHE